MGQRDVGRLVEYPRTQPWRFWKRDKSGDKGKIKEEKRQDDCSKSRTVPRVGLSSLSQERQTKRASSFGDSNSGL